MILASFGTDSGIGVLTWLDQHTQARFQRYRVTLLTNQAELRARQGQLEQAADALGEAARRNIRIRSREKLDRMLDVRTKLSSLTGTRPLRLIDDQLHSQAPYFDLSGTAPRTRR